MLQGYGPPHCLFSSLPVLHFIICTNSIQNSEWLVWQLFVESNREPRHGRYVLLHGMVLQVLLICCRFAPRLPAFLSNLNGLRVSFRVRDFGCVVSPSKVDMTSPDGTKFVLKTEYVCVATGGRPTFPTEQQIPGASLGINSDGFFDL